MQGNSRKAQILVCGFLAISPCTQFSFWIRSHRHGDRVAVFIFAFWMTSTLEVD